MHNLESRGQSSEGFLREANFKCLQSKNSTQYIFKENILTGKFKQVNKKYYKEDDDQDLEDEDEYIPESK